MKELALSIVNPSSSPYVITGPNAGPNMKIFGLDNTLQTAIGAFFIVAIIISLLFLMFGGISWITAGGGKEQMNKSKLGLTYAVVGLVIVLLSFVIVNLIGTIFGVQLLKGL